MHIGAIQANIASERSVDGRPALLGTRALATVVAVAGVILGVLVAAFDGPVVEVLWRGGVMLAGVVCSAVSWRRHRLPVVYALAFVFGAVRLAFVSLSRASFTVPDLTWMQATADIVGGSALVGVLLAAVRARRGRLGMRELLDGGAVALGAGLTAWITLVDHTRAAGVGLPLAMATAVYLPFAVTLVAFTAELLLDGLTGVRGAWLLFWCSVTNLAATAIRALLHTGVLASHQSDLVTAGFVVSFMLLLAGVSDSDSPAILERLDDRAVRPRQEMMQMAPLGASVAAAAIANSLVGATSTTDQLVRTAGNVLLVALVVARLYLALDRNARVQRGLQQRLDCDELTGLHNRERFVAELATALDETWQSGRHVSLVQINVDRFKNINDSLGHDAANRLLVVVAERIRAAALDFGGVVARSMGDEFVVFDVSTATREDALARVDRLQAAVARPVHIGDAPLFVTVSVGLAMAPRTRTISAEELMRRADIATHRAKDDGRNRAVVFDDSMQDRLASRMRVEHALHGAIGRREMRLYYQPIVDIVTGRISGFEALIRWQRADGTIVPPDAFISVAEETGLIGEIGAWALHEALHDLRNWIDDGVVDSTVSMSVNVSPRQLAEAGFAGIVRDALESSGVGPHLLWLEMTESMMIESPDLAETTLRQVRALGVRVALDDFGTGYSSLSLLQKFPIQRIKIDRMFVRGIADEGNDRSLVRTIIAMASSMGLDLVAEGIETIHQLEALRELGCSKAQGYLISHPVPPEAMGSTMTAIAALTSLELFEPDAIDQPVIYDEPLELASASASRPLGAMAVRPIG